MKKNVHHAWALVMIMPLLSASLFVQSQSQITLVSGLGNTNVSVGKPVLSVTSNAVTSSDRVDGAFINAKKGANNYGLLVYSQFGTNYGIGILGEADSAGTTGVGVQGGSYNAASSNYGIYGGASGGLNNWAGYFNGNVFATGTFTPSDEKLKKNIQPEESILTKIKQLTPVSYNYKSEEISYINLPKNLQHGFLAGDLKAVFPEMVIDVEHPVFKDKKFDHSEKSLAINYVMLIPALTKAIQEQQAMIEDLQAKVNSLTHSSGNGLSGVFLGQNAPNPANTSSEIKYTVPPGAGNATLGVFDLTGKMLMQFNGLNGSSQVTVDNAQLPAGIYIYSLLINGQEAVSKKMIILK